jgi:hypothetical protein
MKEMTQTQTQTHVDDNIASSLRGVLVNSFHFIDVNIKNNEELAGH